MIPPLPPKPTQPPDPPGQGSRPGPTNPFIEFRPEEVEQSIPDRFEQQVSDHPHRLALKTLRHEFTYEALNRAANRLAHAILARLLGRAEPEIGRAHV